MLENKLIKIASQSKYCGLKTGETFRCKMKNKICGDEIEVMIYKTLNEIRYETSACIFTQASSAILANNFKKIKNRITAAFGCPIKTVFILPPRL